MSSQIHPDQSADGSAEGAKHPGPSRRSVLYGAAGLAGAGLAATAIGTLAGPAAAASAATAQRGHAGQAAGVPSPAEPVIVHVRDLRSGEMDVFAGESKTQLRDPGLAARLAHAIR
jgi:nitrous oxide reductase